ncbi:riboflavin synthase [soil metagenome]
MFTGIIETLGTVTDIQHEGTNVHFKVRSVITPELKIDQSLSHNGICLTVVALAGDVHTVTAISETLQRTHLGQLKVGDIVNLERAMAANARFDGHMVQGHVDQTAVCYQKETLGGSWKYWFRFTSSVDVMVVEKGSICVNGVSLTVVDAGSDFCSVAIIPYTFENTTFHKLEEGHTVNLEFDIIGKYLARQMKAYNQKG